MIIATVDLTVADSSGDAAPPRTIGALLHFLFILSLFVPLYKLITLFNVRHHQALGAALKEHGIGIQRPTNLSGIGSLALNLNNIPASAWYVNCGSCTMGMT